MGVRNTLGLAEISAPVGSQDVMSQMRDFPSRTGIKILRYGRGGGYQEIKHEGGGLWTKNITLFGTVVLGISYMEKPTEVHPPGIMIGGGVSAEIKIWGRGRPGN